MSSISERVAALPAEKRTLLERRLREAKGIAPGTAIPKLERQNNVFPLSSTQERMWLDHHWYESFPLYTEAIVVRLVGRLQKNHLERSVSEIVRRHEILRTHFENRDGRLVQVVAAPMPATITLIDLCSISRDRRESEVRRLATVEAEWRFALDRLPLFRFTLLRLDISEHVLIFSAHHIIFDGWSVGIIYEELFRLYQAYCEGRSSRLPSLPLQYADYAVWQRDRLAGNALDGELSYWKTRLKDCSTAIELATDRPRPPVRSVEGTRERFMLPAASSDLLSEMANRRGVTMFMMLLTAFQVLLNRYTAEERIAVGAPNTNRNRKELESLIGPFINTFVLATDFSGDPSFVDALSRVQATTIEAYANRELPFEKLVAELQPDRDLSRTPLFQVMFDLQRLPAPTEPAGLSATYVEGNSGTSKFELSLLLRLTGDGISGVWEYSTRLFDRATILRMQDHYRTIIHGVLDDSNRRLSEISLMNDEERRQVLIKWNDTDAPCPEICIQHLFEMQVERTPDRVAVGFEPDSLTYRALNERANRLASWLQQRGVGSEVIVGAHLERSKDLPVALLGILKAGGAYLPLDALLPGERVKLMVDECRVPLILTTSSLKRELSALSTEVVPIDSEWKAVIRHDKQDCACDAGPENLAYVIYTSGSTGAPKGVAVTHRGVVNFLRSMQRDPGLTGDDVLLAVTTLSFDIAFLELFLPLTTGARVVLADRETVFDGIKLAAAIGRYDITAMQATPATWRLMRESGWQDDRGLKILSGGEALSRELANGMLGSGSQLWNLYGPTETTIWSAAYRVESREGTVAIGHPISNTQVYLLDKQFQPSPIAIGGELYIGGHGLARGYLGRPELTAQRFVPDPFGRGLGARLYRTGDLARYRNDGEIEFLGRVDHQLKVRGFRIEPAEVESALESHPSVRKSVVVARKDSRGYDRLVGYLVLESGSAPSVEQLRGHVRNRLPEYMSPSVFVFLESFPLTANGKLDRARLPEPEFPSGLSQSEYIPPSTITEMALGAIWSDLLSYEKIGVHDNFFDLGGYSLLAASLVSKIRNVLGIEAPLSKIFELPTIAGLSDWIDRAHDAPDRVSLPECIVPIQPSGTRSPIFLVHPASGSPNCYVDLAVSIDSDQPLYGFQSPGLITGSRSATRMDEMAGMYIEAMRQIQPAGPYVIGGWSFGSFVALEMARQLEENGHEVALLVLLDTMPQENGGHPLWKNPGYVLSFGTSIVRVLIGPKLPRSYADLKSLADWMGIGLPDSFSGVLRRNTVYQLRFLGGVCLGLVRSLQVFRSNLLSFLRYRPAPFKGRVALLRACERLSNDDGYSADRPNSLAPGGVDVCYVPGNHMTMFDKENAAALAATLDECIAKARQMS